MQRLDKRKRNIAIILILAAVIAAAVFCMASISRERRAEEEQKQKPEVPAEKEQTEDDPAEDTEDPDDEGLSEDIDYLIIVDADHRLPDDWEDRVKTVSSVNSVGDEVRTEEATYRAYLKMKEALEKEGIHVELDSAYRTVEEQQKIIDDFTEKYGSDYAHTYAAEPGTSEHHTGLAIDLYLIVDGKTAYENEDLVKYPEIWARIHEIMPEYGFIQRYSFEDWHLRFVGREAAEEMTEKGLTLEEYVSSGP